MPGTHERFLEYFKKQMIDLNSQILDLGAGHGAFSQHLFQMGFNVQACDLFPELFHYNEITCKKVDITETFPYTDNSFDIVIAIEVSEHILDHENFFSEISRILKPTGKLYISTPNILSLKSRWRFLATGFYYSFKPLDYRNHDGLQHVNSRTLDQYNYIAIKHHFKAAKLNIDRLQRSSRWLYILLFPMLKLYPGRRKIGQMHNQYKLLFGRILFLEFENDKRELISER
jgi:SAM-dependent methyltransferase